MFIYPENLKAKPMLWLWLLRDIGVIGIGALLWLWMVLVNWKKHKVTIETVAGTKEY